MFSKELSKKTNLALPLPKKRNPVRAFLQEVVTCLLAPLLALGAFLWMFVLAIKQGALKAAMVYLGMDLVTPILALLLWSAFVLYKCTGLVLWLTSIVARLTGSHSLADRASDLGDYFVLKNALLKAVIMPALMRKQTQLQDRKRDFHKTKEAFERSFEKTEKTQKSSEEIIQINKQLPNMLLDDVSRFKESTTHTSKTDELLEDKGVDTDKQSFDQLVDRFELQLDRDLKNLRTFLILFLDSSNLNRLSSEQQPEILDLASKKDKLCELWGQTLVATKYVERLKLIYANKKTNTMLKHKCIDSLIGAIEARIEFKIEFKNALEDIMKTYRQMIRAVDDNTLLQVFRMSPQNKPIQQHVLCVSANNGLHGMWADAAQKLMQHNAVDITSFDYCRGDNMQTFVDALAVLIRALGEDGKPISILSQSLGGLLAMEVMAMLQQSENPNDRAIAQSLFVVADRSPHSIAAVASAHVLRFLPKNFKKSKGYSQHQRFLKRCIAFLMRLLGLGRDLSAERALSHMKQSGKIKALYTQKDRVVPPTTSIAFALMKTYPNDVIKLGDQVGHNGSDETALLQLQAHLS